MGVILAGREEDANPSRNKGDSPEDGEEDAATLMHKLLAALKRPGTLTRVSTFKRPLHP